jgi:two-component system, OmpR family, phosphate regulon sensor histidine kinase PhoR
MYIVKVRSPTTVFLHRARLVFMLTALIPTVCITVIGIVLVATGSRSVAFVGGILVLALCGTAFAGYALGTMFVTRGASLATMQNDFLSSVSHEVRTPLTSIRLFIETLREERVTDPVEKKRCLTIIDEELGRLDGLVGKLSMLSRLESRHTAFDRQAVAVTDIVAEALVALDALRLGAPMDLRVEVAAGLVVRGDPGALAQALANLLANAWKYTPPKDKRIAVSAVGDASRVTIEVTDNGPGVSPDETEIIFEKFQRGSAATDSGTVGTGLGLSVVRAIVAAHGGEVDVIADEPRGARFRIVLPRARAAEAA